MTPFTKVEGIGVPMMKANIDTDIIYPARYLVRMDKQDIGQYLFHDWRFDDAGEPCTDFILNNPVYAKSPILVGGERFGSGSSREHAVWALADFGFRCLIAPSFGEIFKSNCLANGILAIELDQDICAKLASRFLEIDLISCTISSGNDCITFAIDPGKRDALLSGYDMTDAILAHRCHDIEMFEIRQREQQPWLYKSPEGQRI
jgi:3-isopropylmalate/(R)-2-methylmalate dehydratase small subunit